jgi:Na+-driven multidrug efflux pump
MMCTGAGNLLNAILDVVLIYPLGLGVSGAALATVTSEYVDIIMIFSVIKFVFHTFVMHGVQYSRRLRHV